jgi:two-component system LytT family response regulator
MPERPLRVVVVDDEPLGRERLRTLLAAEPHVRLVGEYATGEEALAAIAGDPPDVAFLDVQMPGTDGLALARRVAERVPADRSPVIVFVTAYSAYALEAFEVRATDYLLKPFDRSRFRDALERARERVGARAAAPCRFVVRTGARLHLVPADDVDWIAGDGNYVRLHGGGRSHLVRETLKSVERRLDPARFVRIHRSAIVNVGRIASLTPHVHGQYVVRMRDGARLTSSRTHSGRLRTLLRPAG